MRLHLFLASTAALVATSAAAIEPRSIASVAQIRPDHGAVRLSLQSQVQQQGTIHLWFLRDGGDPSRSADLLKFERKQGVPLLGQNTVDSRPVIYSVPPGRYRLLAYGVACPMLPPPGVYACSATMNNIPVGQMPARRYEGDVPSFDVAEGGLTDAGEFILEARPGAPIQEKQALEFLFRDHRAFEIRVRATAAPIPPAFAKAVSPEGVIVPEEFQSRISCRQRPKSAMMYLPFDC